MARTLPIIVYLAPAAGRRNGHRGHPTVPVRRPESTWLQAQGVTEGLSAIEAGNRAGEHGERDKEEREKKLNRAISMFEAALLALVGY